MILSDIEINKYFTDPNKRHLYYDETIKLAAELCCHANGEYDKKLIAERRPYETEDNQKYREKIAIGINEDFFSVILSSLMKIRKSPDWAIKYKSEDTPKVIAEGETLSDYCELKFPFFTSLTNWMFNVYLEQSLTDPNTICVVLPLQYVNDESEYLRPFPFLFKSVNVFDYVNEKYCVLLSEDKCEYTEGGTTFYDGLIYYIITDERIQVYKQVKSNKTMVLDVDYEHKLGFMPAFRLLGKYWKSSHRTIINKSLVNASLPYLKEAAREYNDSQIEMVQNVFTERWVYNNQVCTDCQGSAWVPGVPYIENGIPKQGSPVRCKKCNGKGRPLRSGFEYVEINPPGVGETAVPTPPMGQIVKNHEVIKIMEARIDRHKYKALAAINMQFTAQVPLSISGDAKMADRAESESFVSANAENLIAVMDKIYFIINEYRYSVIVPNKDQRISMLPTIPVPQNFDLFDSSYLANEMKAVKGTVSSTVYNAMEVEYANKKFQNDPEISERLELIMTLDPFAGISEVDKSAMLADGGIDKIDYIISCNIVQFIDRAIFEYKGKPIEFEDEKYNVQIELFESYAQEIEDSNSAKEIVTNDLLKQNSFQQ